MLSILISCPDSQDLSTVGVPTRSAARFPTAGLKRVYLPLVRVGLVELVRPGAVQVKETGRISRRTRIDGDGLRGCLDRRVTRLGYGCER
jgi:hypothetical protein